MLALPPAPPGVVPYIARYSEEKLLKPRIVQHPLFPGVAYADETPYDRDSFGMLWVRPVLLPKRRRGEPRLREIHAYRQRRAMANMLCQVCTRPPEDPDEPPLFLLKDTSGLVVEGERTASPPVCVPCAGISIHLCHGLRGGHYVAARAMYTPAWGVAGLVYDPDTLTPHPGKDLERVEYGTPRAAWTVAARSVVALYGVTPVDLDEEFARFGMARLEDEFARVAGLVGAGL
ncbi:hypothetical protein [Streptomyces vastus]|uniref:Uncharacterized protein n=1 Tax=Streptomyces vastus TaxID=285451 RepID=A0ABN3QAP9_9ACTN